MLDLARNGQDDPPSRTEIDRHLLDLSRRGDRSCVQDVVTAHLAGGGDRVRWRLAYETSRCAGQGPASAIAVASCVEALHQASLVHDDMTDRSATRRGHPAVWAEHGDAVALAVGDHLISLAHACVAEAGEVDPRRSLWLVHRAVSSTIRGQCEELKGAADEGAQAGTGIYTDWSRIAVLKAGPLLALGPELALAPRHDAEAVAAMRAACHRLAIGYQGLDDCKDMDDDRDETGLASNLCLRLEAAGLTTAEAVETALFHAEGNLRAAARDAADMPGGIGGPLARLCATKLRGMEALLDAF